MNNQGVLASLRREYEGPPELYGFATPEQLYTTFGLIGRVTLADRLNGRCGQEGKGWDALLPGELLADGNIGPELRARDVRLLNMGDEVRDISDVSVVHPAKSRYFNVLIYPDGKTYHSNRVVHADPTSISKSG